MKNILFLSFFLLCIVAILAKCTTSDDSSHSTTIPTQELINKIEEAMPTAYPIMKNSDELLSFLPEDVLKQYLDYLYRKQCEAAFALQTIHAERDRDVFMLVCNEEEGSSVSSLVEIQPLAQWMAQTECQVVGEWVQESDTKKIFYLQEQWQTEQRDKYTVSFWAELQLIEGEWKVSRFHTWPPCNNLKFPSYSEASSNGVENVDYPTTPDEVVFAYYRNLNLKKCVDAYILFAENKLFNPWKRELGYCEFSNFATWEVKEVLPYIEWVIVNRCNGNTEINIDEELRTSNTKKSFYVHIRRIGRPEYVGKVGAGFLQEEIYEHILVVELINGKWRITNIRQAYDGGNPCR